MLSLEFILLINQREFSELVHISYGTEWNVVSRGCTCCIKINFADGVVLFLAVHYGAFWFIEKKNNEILLWFSKHLKWNWSDAKISKFSFVEWYSCLLTTFCAKGVSH